MKILLVHNYYGSEAPSGENYVFELEQKMLEAHGHEVRILIRHSDEIRAQGWLGLVRGAMASVWNPISAHQVKKLVAEFQPDVVHAHNTFPLLSPSIFHAVGKNSAVVLTLHNYRLLCAAAIPMRGGEVCTQCITRRSSLPAMQHGCYRDSRLATAPLAANVSLHRALGTWQSHVDAFIALSEFQKEVMIQGGMPSEKLHVKPNFYPGVPDVLPFERRPGYVVFVGRLGKEKGVRNLVEAWKAFGTGAPLLRVIGDGPLMESLKNEAQGLPVEFLGQVSAEEAQAQISEASLLVLPSEWFEGFPMVIREAFAFGTPVGVSNIGPLPSIVRDGENGVVFEPANARSLLEAVRAVWLDQEALASLSLGARESFEKFYNESANYRILMDIYQKAINENERPL